MAITVKTFREFIMELPNRDVIMRELKQHIEWGDHMPIRLSDIRFMFTTDELYICSCNPGKTFRFKWCSKCREASAFDILTEGI